MEQQTTTVKNNIELETSEEFFSIFEGVGSESPTGGNCTTCGNNFFFAVRLAL